tara:strand:- start:7290 stop:7676 length:387 start_codon:yes stop_codon:yes gene_type:complete
MAYKTIYNTETGVILRTRDISDVLLQKYLARTPNSAAIDGVVKQPSTKLVDLETLEIVEKPVVWNMPVYLRQNREHLLITSDWTQGADSPLSDAKKIEWQTYRQALRDLTTTSSATHPDDVVWPSKPE